ncbi:MAG: NAD-dependent epimerase/dehydratase family protein [Oligoflexia bacterium]|nr:NAD-dependent epimerase/dehydratase family protein [Oligoflexia bacterium]
MPVETTNGEKQSKQNKKEKVLILGACGFIGKNLQNFIVEQALYKQFDFVGVDLAVGVKTSEGEYCKMIECNLIEKGRIRKLLEEERPEYILNLMGKASGDDLGELIHLNATFSEELIKSANELQENQRPKKILLVGSAAEYGIQKQFPIREESELNPQTLYGLSKVIQTQIFKFYRGRRGAGTTVPLNLVRTFNIIGPYMPRSLAIGSFVEKIKKYKASGEAICVGNLESRRDFLDVRDVLDAYFQVLLQGSPGEIYNVCRGRSIKMQEIWDTLLDAFEVKGAMVVNGASTDVKSCDLDESYGDNSKLKYAFGWGMKLVEEKDALLQSLRAVGTGHWPLT